MNTIYIIIAIIFVVSWVVNKLAALTGNETNTSGNNAERKRRSLDEWDEIQARRRAENAGQLEELHLDASAQPPPPMPHQATPRDLSQLSMAERIELARQRARQQAGGQGGEDPAEGLRQARERAEAEAQRRRQLAEQQRREQADQAQRQQAQRARERQAAERRRAQEQRARAEQEAKRRSRQRRSSSGSKRPSSGGTGAVQAGPSRVSAESYKRVHHGQSQPGSSGTGATQPIAVGPIAIGNLDAVALRKAFIMKELLDKPVALRGPQDDLLS